MASIRSASSIQSSKDDLEKIIDRRLARIFGEDAEILVIYPLHSPEKSMASIQSDLSKDDLSTISDLSMDKSDSDKRIREDV